MRGGQEESAEETENGKREVLWKTGACQRNAI